MIMAIQTVCSTQTIRDNSLVAITITDNTFIIKGNGIITRDLSVAIFTIRHLNYKTVKFSKCFQVYHSRRSILQISLSVRYLNNLIAKTVSI